MGPYRLTRFAKTGRIGRKMRKLSPFAKELQGEDIPRSSQMAYRFVLYEQ